VVLHAERDAIAVAQPESLEELRAAIRALIQLPIRNDLSASGHDVCGLVR
jgi:hypothetical protein